jgi:hypothetical protein
MRSILVTILLISSFVNIKCKKKAEDDTPKIDVSKITTTDIAGNAIGAIDNTDWTFDNTWTDEEMKLMQVPTNAQLSGTEASDITFVPAFPNPLSSVFTFVVQAPKPACIQLVITDDRLQIKDRFFLKSNNANGPYFLSMINMDAAKYTNNTNYRVYYGLFSLADGLFIKGHGDIRIQR